MNLEGPARRLEYLGVVVDAESETLRISETCRQELLGLLRDFKGRCWCDLRALKSLVGKLSFDAAVLPGSCPFMRRMIDCMRGHGVKGRVRLGAGFQADVDYWFCYIGSWNGWAT